MAVHKYTMLIMLGPGFELKVKAERVGTEALPPTRLAGWT